MFLESDFSNSRPLALSFEETARWYSTTVSHKHGTGRNAVGERVGETEKLLSSLDMNAQTIRRDQDIQELRRLLQELDRAEQERYLQLQERDRQLQERGRQLQELDQKLRTIKSASVWNYFLEGKSLPPLKRRGCATVVIPNNKFLRPVKAATPSVLGILPLGEDLEELTSMRTTNMFSSTELVYATEKGVRDHCKLVLEDLIHAANLKSTLQLRGDLSIAEFHSHDLVISVDDNPVGAVEIKLPVKTRGKHQLINFGQLFDSMMRIRSFRGLKNVFGIVTNFEEWTIAWFPDTDFCATSTLDNPDAYRQTEIAVDTALKRRLHISPTYTRQEAKPLALALYSVLRKMAASAKFFEPVPLLSATRPYVLLKRSSWVWKSGLQLKKLRFQPPNTFALGFDLLRDLDGGADGKVWLACDGAGHLSVIKVLRGIEEGDQAVEVGIVKEEVKRWHQCGLKTVFSCRLADRHAIIMT